MTLVGKRIVVTAGASGIGLVMARAFLAQGARVHIADKDAQALRDAATSLTQLSTSLCDVADPAQVKAMMQGAVDALGGLDVLINNAGVAGPTASVEDTDPLAWMAVLDVNLTGTFLVTQQAIPHLKRSAAGVILNMSSLAGRFGYPNRSPYAASKWGLIGFTKTLSRELGEFGIRVNAILPGAVQGKRIDRIFESRANLSGRTVEEERLAGLANQSIKRFVPPEEIAALATFLISDAGRSISGQMLPIDGDSQNAA